MSMIILCGVLLVLYCVYSFAYAPYQVWRRYGIKGPTPVPFFGNYREEAKMWQMKLKYYEYLHQKYGPVVGFYIGKAPYILITDLDMLKQIFMKDFNNFMDHADGPEMILPKVFRGLFLMKGDTWKTNRRILSPTFSISKVKTMIPLVKKSVDILLAMFDVKVATGASFDVTKVYGSFTTETILAVAFGQKSDSTEVDHARNELTKAVDSLSQQIEEGRMTSFGALIVLISNFPWLIPVLRFVFLHSSRSESFRYLNEIALDLVRCRRESAIMHRDMLQSMIDATGEINDDGRGCPAKRMTERLTDEQVVGEAIGILLAGYETTANTLAYTSYLLALNPDIQEKLQSEIDSYFEEKPDASMYEACQDIAYLDNVIQESLRLYPAVPILTRLCLKTTVVKGLTIPQGSSIIIPSFMIHKDNLYWRTPDTFDPGRFSAEERAKRPQLAHMPFGFGPRNCIGMRFALLEAKMALIAILSKYTFIKDSKNTEVPLQVAIGFTLSPKNGIYLKVIKRT